MALAFHRSGALVLAMLVAVASVAARQSGPQAVAPTGLIVGKTVDGVTGAVIGGAIVSISRALPPPGAIRTEDPTAFDFTPTRVISDSNGRFMFHGLAAGSFSLSASKPGYADGVFGRRFATDIGSQSLALRDGERRGDVTLGLWQRGTLGGTV